MQDLDIEVASTRVTVDLIDANDNSPVFPHSAYRLRVLENIRPGSLISNITATDIDSKEFGSITYSIKGFGAEKFYTKSKEGGLYMAKGICASEFFIQKHTSFFSQASSLSGQMSDSVNLIISTFQWKFSFHSNLHK